MRVLTRRLWQPIAPLIAECEEDGGVATATPPPRAFFSPHTPASSPPRRESSVWFCRVCVDAFVRRRRVRHVPPARCELLHHPSLI